MVHLGKVPLHSRHGRCVVVNLDATPPLGQQRDAAIDVLERGGRYVTSGAIAGPIVSLDLRTLYLRDLTFFGSTVIDLDVMTTLIGYIEAGSIRPALAATFALEDLHKAQTAFIEKRSPDFNGT